MGQVSDQHHRPLLGRGRLGDRTDIVAGIEPCDGDHPLGWIQSLGQQGGRLLSPPLAAVSDLTHLRADLGGPDGHPADRLLSPIGQRPLRVLGLRFGLAVLHRGEFMLPPAGLIGQGVARDDTGA
jgi:hypothetical protein